MKLNYKVTLQAEENGAFLNFSTLAVFRSLEKIEVEIVKLMILPKMCLILYVLYIVYSFKKYFIFAWPKFVHVFKISYLKALIKAARQKQINV